MTTRYVPKTSRASKPSSTYLPTYHRVPHRTYHGTPRTFLTSLTSVWRSSPVRQNIHGCMHDHFLCKSPNTLCRRRCRNNNVSTPHLVLSADEMFFPEPKTRIFCSIPRRATEFKKTRLVVLNKAPIFFICHHIHSHIYTQQKARLRMRRVLRPPPPMYA